MVYDDSAVIAPVCVWGAKNGKADLARGMNELCSHGKEVSQNRYMRAFKSNAFDIIRNKPIIEIRQRHEEQIAGRKGS